METVSALLIEPVISALVGHLIPLLIPQKIFPAKVAEHMEKWKTILEDFRGVLEDAENKKDNDRGLRNWLGDLEEFIYDVEDLIECLCYKVSQHHVQGSPETVNKIVKWPKRMWKNFGLTRKFDKIAERLQSLESRKKDLEHFHLQVLCRTFSSTSVGSSRSPSTSLSSNELVVLGRNDDKRVVMEALFSETKGDFNYEVIPIVGIAGLGKTTLARYVFNDDQVNTFFDKKVWVCVSSSFDIHRITTEILKAVSPDCNVNGQSLSLIQVQLSSSLSGKKFLIVLDDLWTENYNDWLNLRPPFSFGSLGSRIIVTTRSMKAAEKVKTMEVMNLKRLSENDCLQLICEHAVLDPTQASVYIEMAKEIAKKCSGLPLAAMNVGGHLRYTERIEEWKDILNNKSWTMNDGGLDTLSVLRMSYDGLNPQLKRCFAFFLMLPVNYEFNEIEIVLMWVGVGVIQLIDGRKSKKEIGHDCFHQLLSRSFFSPIESGYKKRYMMHDLYRDLAMEVSGGGRYIGETDEIPKSFKSLRHIVCHCSRVGDVNDIVKREGPLPLRAFISFRIRGIANRFQFHDMLPQVKYLRAFSHPTMGDDKGLLAESFGQLILLKYLDLSCSDFQRLPDSVTSLYNLETLILTKCEGLLQLPEKIGNLINLSHLDVAWCKKLKKLPDRIEDLGELGYLRVEFCEELQELPDGIEKLGNLSHLDVGWCQKIKELPAGIGELRKLSYLSVKSCKELKKLPVGIEKLENLCFLDISSCSECEELPTDIGNLQNLCHLNLSSCRKLKEIPESITKVGNLNHLDASYCEELKKLPQEIGELLKLCRLNLVSCTKLEELPESFEKLKNLTHLNLNSCTELKKLPSGIGELDKLVYLEFDQCLKVEEMPAGIGNLRKLQKLTKFIIGDNLSLSSLEHLNCLTGRLEICGLEKVMSPDDASKARLSDKRLNELVLVWDSNRNRVQGTTAGQILNLLQPHEDLKSLKMKGYGGSLFPHWLETSLRNLTKLRLVECKKCNSSRMLDMPSLKMLEIIRSPLLLNQPLLSHLSSLVELFIAQIPSDVLKLILGVELSELRVLTLVNCEDMNSFLSEDTDIKSVRLTCSVRNLSLHGFPHLKLISSSRVLASVSKLELLNCPVLEGFPNEGLPPSIQELLVTDCPLLARKLLDRDQDLFSKIPDSAKIKVDGFTIRRSALP